MVDRASHMKLVTAVLAKNEGAPDRYLERVLQNALSFSDTVLLLDDSSTDNTRELALDLGVRVSKRAQGEDAWGHEARPRAELWGWGTREARDGWLLIQDADMLLHGDPRPLAASWDCNAWAWPLWDLWDDEQHARVDGPWSGGPTQPRPWMFRPSVMGGLALHWPNRGIHVGHAPDNFPLICGVAPPDIYWLHYSYLRPEHRKAKFDAYASVASQLTPFEQAHAASIMDAR